MFFMEIILFYWDKFIIFIFFLLNLVIIFQRYDQIYQVLLKHYLTFIFYLLRQEQWYHLMYQSHPFILVIDLKYLHVNHLHHRIYLIFFDLLHRFSRWILLLEFVFLHLQIVTVLYEHPYQQIVKQTNYHWQRKMERLLNLHKLLLTLFYQFLVVLPIMHL